MNSYSDRYDGVSWSASLGRGLLSLAAVLVLSLGVGCVVLFGLWGILGLLASVAFALPVAESVLTSLEESRSAMWSRHERRRLLLDQLETVAGNVKAGRPRELPRPILTGGLGLKLEEALKKHPVSEVDQPAEVSDYGWDALELVLDAIEQKRGKLSWSALRGPLNDDRALWEWSLHHRTGILPGLGLVQGRQPGGEGCIPFPPDEAKRLAKTMWGISNNGALLSRTGVNDR